LNNGTLFSAIFAVGGNIGSYTLSFLKKDRFLSTDNELFIELDVPLVTTSTFNILEACVKGKAGGAGQH